MGYNILAGDDLENFAAVSQGASLCLGDQLFCIGTQQLSLGIGGLDGVVLEQVRRQVSQQVSLLLGGASESGTLLRGRHNVLLVCG